MITLSSRGARSARCASLLAIALAGTCCRVTWAQEAPATQPPTPRPDAIVYRVQSATQRLELIVNSSRILTLDKKITQAQVSNTDILDITPLSATQVQISAKKAGVTQVNLWDP